MPQAMQAGLHLGLEKTCAAGVLVEAEPSLPLPDSAHKHSKLLKGYFDCTSHKRKEADRQVHL